MMNKRFGLLRLLLLFLVTVCASACMVGCSGGTGGDSGPRDRLQQYVSRSFAVKAVEDRELLLEHLTGDAKIRLASWSADQFKSAFIDARRTFVKLVINDERKVDPEHTDVTYEIVFLDGSKAAGAGAKVTQRKVCRLQREGGQWKIAEVRNIKELVEYQGEMSFP